MQQGQMLAGFAALRARRAQGVPPKKKGKKRVGDQLTPGDAVDARKPAGRKPALGSGQRFDQLSSALAQKPRVTSPGGLAASIGRKSLGKNRFQQLAAKGKPGY